MALCPSGQTGLDLMFQFEFIKAVTCTFAVPAGGVLVVGTIVFGAIALSSFIRTGSPIIPLGLLMLTGGAVMSTVAGVATTIATVTFLLVSAGAFAYLYYRWG